MAFDGGGRGHRRAHQVRAPARALAALEVAVRGGGAALALLEAVGVHAEAHRAARLAPFEAGVAEDAVEPFALGLLLDQPGTGNHQGKLDVGSNAAAAHYGGCSAQILDARVGARADEHLVADDLCNEHATVSSPL